MTGKDAGFSTDATPAPRAATVRDNTNGEAASAESTPGLSGLTSAEASRRLLATGPNIIFKPSPIRFLDILWEEVREPMILLLLVVGVLYSLLGRPADAITIFVVILLLILAEVQSEFRAKRAVRRLSEIASPKAAVMRDGAVRRIEAAEVVPEDSLVLSTGTRIAADATVVTTVGLQVDESAITGESYPADKSPGDAVYASTVVVSGEALARVTTTGASTKIGALAQELKTVKPPRTPLQQMMRDLSGKLVWVAVFFSTVIPIIGAIRGEPLGTMVLTGLSLAFATIPEELPIIITMVLGIGSYRLSKQNFLVKRLAAAETMGAVSVIVTDKTGTLTEGRMKLTAVHTTHSEREAVADAMGAVSPLDDTPVDVAIRARAAELEIPADTRAIMRERELGVGSKTKAVLRDDALYVSGAPEEVFARCAHVPHDISAALETEAAQGNREVAVAMRRIGPTSAAGDAQNAPWDHLERDMELVALLSFSDPPRPEVPQAIAQMKVAGVRTIMVTGDHPATAAAIAREVGILDDAASGARLLGVGSNAAVATGTELDSMDDALLRERVATTAVFARATPEHKYRIVDALQHRDLVVAVTGDGVNDALALKGADVGIAMGMRGTDVAREAAGAVLADDNYATIEKAVFEGRVFYDNLRKGVKYYLSVKIALIAVFLLPALLGSPLPFSPVQIILLELFMDLAASAGFVAEPAEPDIRTRPPVAKSSGVFDGPQIRDLFVKGLLLFAAIMITSAFARARGVSGSQLRTLAFSAWMVGHVALAFVSRSDRVPLSRVGLFSNRVIDAWAVASAVVLLVGIYVPAIGERINLVKVPLPWLLATAAFAIGWLSLLEAWKALRARRDGLEPAVEP